MVLIFRKLIFPSVLGFGFFGAAFFAHAAGNLTGYAWADNGIGWISFNCSNGGVCGASNYGVTVAQNGMMSGYAWANPNDGGQNHIGWINFNPSRPYPNSSYVPNQSARMNPGTGEVRGWARAVNYDLASGWDGWIGFGSGGNYGSGVAVTGCNWSGYAWGGGTNIGWIHFANPSPSYGVTGSGNGCATLPDLTAGSISPTAAVAITLTQFSATISNTGAAPTGSVFTNLFQFDDNADHASVFATLTDTSPALAVGGTDVSQVSYTFSTSGTWYIRTCADNNASFVGTITESDESNNCGAWTAVTVTAPILTGTFSASPDTIDPGNPSTLTWTSNATNCTGAGFSTGASSPANGSAVVAPTTIGPNSYQITCTKSGYSPLTLGATVTVISITSSISAKPSCISGGGSSKVSWSVLPATQIRAGSCTLSGPGLSSNPLSVSPDGSAPNASPQTAVVPSSKSTYTIACTTTGGTAVTKSATVDVTSCWTEF